MGDEFRRLSFETWERMAAGWERRSDQVWEASEIVGRHLVEQLAPRPGETILELAAGIGQTGFLAAEAVGAEGRLISTDFAPAMVEAARRFGERLGLGDVEYRVMDAEHIELESDSVDGVLCRWGYMLMADPAGALAETRRVLRSGGRLAFSVWGAPERNPWALLVGKVLVDRGAMPPPDPSQPGIFNMAAEKRIRELVRSAGFESLEIDEVPMRWTYVDFADYWAFTMDLAGALSMMITQLPDSEQREIRAAVQRAAEPFRTNGGYTLEGLCLNMLAR